MSLIIHYKHHFPSSSHVISDLLPGHVTTLQRSSHIADEVDQMVLESSVFHYIAVSTVNCYSLT